LLEQPRDRSDQRVDRREAHGLGALLARLVDPERRGFPRPVPADSQAHDEQNGEAGRADHAGTAGPRFTPRCELLAHGLASGRDRRYAYGPSVSRRPPASELPQHVVEDAAVDEVLLLLRGVDPHERLELRALAVRRRRGHANLLDALGPGPLDVEGFLSREP